LEGDTLVIKCLTIHIQPTTKIQPSAWPARRELRIIVDTDGEVFTNSKVVWASDLMSVFDLLFDHAKYELKLALEKADALAEEKSPQ
jgi:hypothetical protein